MWRSLVLLLIGITGAFSPFEAMAQRADALGVDGIYEGTIGMQLDNAKAKEYQAKAKLVVLPDGKGAVLTAQHPDGVVSVVMRGTFRGATFISGSKGKLD